MIYMLTIHRRTLRADLHQKERKRTASQRLILRSAASNSLEIEYMVRWVLDHRVRSWQSFTVCSLCFEPCLESIASQHLPFPTSYTVPKQMSSVYPSCCVHVQRECWGIYMSSFAQSSYSDLRWLRLAISLNLFASWPLPLSTPSHL